MSRPAKDNVSVTHDRRTFRNITVVFISHYNQNRFSLGLVLDIDGLVYVIHVANHHKLVTRGCILYNTLNARCDHDSQL